MKYLLTPLLILSSIYHVFSQTTMQASIRRGTNAMTVDIYLRPSTSFSQKDEVMNLAIALPATVTPVPSGESGNTPNGTGPLPGMTGIIPNFLVNNLGSLLRSVVVTSEPVNGVPHYVYTFVFNSTAAAEHVWTANQEQLIFTISFEGCTTNCSTIGMKLVNLPGGGLRNQANWYFQANTISDITNYPAPFYANSETLPLFGGGSTDGSALAYLELANVLPVRMHSLAAATQDCKVNLQWQVTEEANFAYYAIERSENAINFNEAGRISASNNSEAKKTYTFSDATSPSGTIFYRIRQVDKDGSFNYSALTRVNLNCGAKNRVLVYPSITKGNIHVKLPPGYEGARITVINSDGKPVVVNNNAGVNRILNLQQFANGTYTVQVINQRNITDRVKVILLH